MGTLHRSLLPSCRRLVFAILLVLFQTQSALSGPLYIRDPSPRAALVALVSPSQQDQMVASVAQLEQRFNSKYRYDWVFFSYEDLSEDFKDATSNATASTVTYNLIPQQHWSIPGSVDPGRFEAAAHHKSRWSAGLFAREKRLQAYDWFWMVEPGTQFMCDINVDIFRLMKERGIAYGVSKAPYQNIDDSELLWQSTKSFINKHPELVQPTADITWILGDGGNLSKPSVSSDYFVDYTDETEINRDLHPKTRPCRASGPETEGGVRPSVSHEADPQQCFLNLDAGDCSAWLPSAYDKCDAITPIEIGNLNHFRGLQHSSYFNHLDDAGDFYYGYTGNVPVHSLSATMFLPREKFWLPCDIFCEMRSLQSCPSVTRPIFDIDIDIADDSTFLTDIFGSSWFQSYEDSQLSVFHRIWANLAWGIARQNAIPAPQTGHTVLDERNFKIYKPERYPVNVNLGWYSLEDTWRSWSIDRTKWFLTALGW
ncbi:Alpha-1,2 mannosyltransferase KTR1 [Colletotrichum tanaceti]|uniref:Alpha-1,2 mannosyltransferase KTR1 n=1 Tax=Colletotrichum tanaceti TaxID=1306861 RepID=A0A4U6X5B5_9PEZI|nr:Alpha-1,2 mannosyltransferase KTR1 [Colletotrichum tanaceti]TKW50019.1 Alpha-1,2 mannosyltransferase KTR1 [Colletotrichum tanaceti]